MIIIIISQPYNVAEFDIKYEMKYQNKSILCPDNEVFCTSLRIKIYTLGIAE